MTHKAQTSIIDFVSLLGSQRVLSSILCQGRTPLSRNEILVYNRARNCSVDFQTLWCNSTLTMGPSGKIAKSTELSRHCIFNPVSCVRGARIISVCFLWEINFWYSWRAVYSMNAKLIASGLSWSYKKLKKSCYWWLVFPSHLLKTRAKKTP